MSTLSSKFVQYKLQYHFINYARLGDTNLKSFNNVLKSSYKSNVQQSVRVHYSLFCGIKYRGDCKISYNQEDTMQKLMSQHNHILDIRSFIYCTRTYITVSIKSIESLNAYNIL